MGGEAEQGKPKEEKKQHEGEKETRKYEGEQKESYNELQ